MIKGTVLFRFKEDPNPHHLSKKTLAIEEKANKLRYAMKNGGK